MSVDSSLHRGFSTSGSSSRVLDPQSQSEGNGNDQNFPDCVDGLRQSIWLIQSSST